MVGGYQDVKILERAGSITLPFAAGPQPGNLREFGGRERKAQKTRPTGILAFNDRCATGVLDILLRAGVAVPGQVSVVGFDDSHLASFSHIDLTTVRQDASVMAELAVERAVQRLTHQAGTTPSNTDAGGHEAVIPPTLVVRGTTAPIALPPA